MCKYSLLLVVLYWFCLFVASSYIIYEEKRKKHRRIKLLVVNFRDREDLIQHIQQLKEEQINAIHLQHGEDSENSKEDERDEDVEELYIVQHPQTTKGGNENVVIEEKKTRGDFGVNTEGVIFTDIGAEM